MMAASNFGMLWERIRTRCGVSLVVHTASEPRATGDLQLPPVFTPVYANTPARIGQHKSFPDVARFIVVLVILSALSWYPRRQGALDMRWDGSVYYVLGTSLAQGKGYRLLNEPGEIKANQYPPLLPLIIAAHQKLLGTSDPFVVGPWLKLSFVLCSAFVAAGSYLLFLRFMPPVWAKCAGVVYVFNLPSYLHFNMVAAELPFAAALVVFLLAHYGRPTAVRPIVVAVAACAAFLLRTVGLVLFATWIGDAILRRDFRRAAVRSIIAVLCVAPWYMYVHRVEASSEYKHPVYPYQRAEYLYYNVSYARNMTYIDPYRPELGKASASDTAHRIIGNVIATPGLIGQAVTSFRSFWIGQSASVNMRAGVRLLPPWIVDALLIVIGCIVITGFVVLARGGESFLPLYALATVAAVWLTPWPLQHVRYLSPSIPVLLVGLFTALHTAYERATHNSRSVRRGIRGAVVCLISLIGVEEIATYYQAHTKYLVASDVVNRTGTAVVYKQLFYYAENVAMDDCITWIAQHATQSDIVAASMAHWVNLRTGLKTVMPPLEADASVANRLLDSVPVRYLVQETPSFYASRYVSNAVQADAARWRLVYVAKADDVRVYERVLAP